MKTYIVIASKNKENDKFLLMNENAEFSNVMEMVGYYEKNLIGQVRFLQIGNFLQDVSRKINFDNSLGYCKINY